MPQNTKVIVFGGGCFWCTEAVFRMLKGVVSVIPGYAGGEQVKPTYEEVSSGETEHAEVIRIDYDPNMVNFSDLLTVFFVTHDPTSVDQQGSDVGSQYRSCILYTDNDQREGIQKFIEEINASEKLGRPVITEVEPLKDFYPAEEYHREYYARNPMKAYCQLVIQPKLRKLRKEFEQLLKKDASSSLSEGQ
jgi:peptide-methionine (S)-S-oxide reductase